MRNNKNNITLSSRNMISFWRNSTAHLTGLQKISTLCFAILMLSFLSITLCFQSNFVSALSYQTYQRLDFTFNPTIQLTLSSSELTIPNLTPGSSSDSNIIDINVATNTFGGLNLVSTVGNSNNDTTSLVYRNGNTIIGSFDTLSTTAATLEDIGNNKYGYSYSIKGNDNTWSNYSNYASLPKYDDTVSTPAILLSTTGTATSGAVKFKLGAKASSTQPSGTYTNVVNFSATTKPLTTTYTINFQNGSGASNWPSDISGTILDNVGNIQLGSAPTKTDYVFEGWCTVSTDNGDCAGNVYQANEAYPISNIGDSTSGDSLIINLYAMWKGASIYELEYLQDFSSLSNNAKASIVDSMGEETTYTLKDKRDEQSYTIVKLKDGKIWMTENLNLAGDILLSSDTTDFDQSYTLPTDQGWQSDGRLPSSSTKGFSTNNYAYVYNSGSEVCKDGSNYQPCYTYYSWDAATLGSGRTISTDNTDAPYSICPKGWKLPNTYNGTDSSTDFRALMIAYGGSSTVQNYGPNMFYKFKDGTIPNFQTAGFYYTSSYNKGSGFYWSSTSSDSINNARTFALFQQYVYTANSDKRGYGFSVRCLVR